MANWWARRKSNQTLTGNCQASDELETGADIEWHRRSNQRRSRGGNMVMQMKQSVASVACLRGIHSTMSRAGQGRADEEGGGGLWLDYEALHVAERQQCPPSLPAPLPNYAIYLLNAATR